LGREVGRGALQLTPKIVRWSIQKGVRMLLDEKPFDQIEGEDILGLIPGVAESRRIDYKSAIPGDSERDVRSLLTDVCALANAGGGYLLYGISEERDDDGNSTGVPESVIGVGAVNENRVLLDLQQRINQGIEPRIIGHRARFVTAGEGAKVLVVYVPRSLLSPHRITYRGARDFYIRHDRGNQLMDMMEIRHAVLDVAGLPQQVEEHRSTRVSRILAGETPIQLLPNCAVFMLHIIPISHFTEAKTVDVTGVKSRPMQSINVHVTRSRLNADGFLFYGGVDSEYERGYVQLFRDGVLEFCATHEDQPREYNGMLGLSSQWQEEGFLVSLRQGLELLSELGIEPPLYIGLTLARIRGAAMTRPQRFWRFEDGDQIAFDKDLILAPTVVVESADENPAHILRPAFDAVWQASGFPYSPYYNDEGDWVRS
jgi:hypothetical protein